MKLGAMTDPNRLWSMVDHIVPKARQPLASVVGHILTGRTPTQLAERQQDGMRDVLTFTPQHVVVIRPKSSIGFFSALRSARSGSMNRIVDTSEFSSETVVGISRPSTAPPEGAEVNRLMLDPSKVLQVDLAGNRSLHLLVDDDMTNTERLAWLLDSYVEAHGARGCE